MENISISFEYQGKTYTGVFTQVSGAGSSGTWHLMINNFYRGQLVLSDKHGWQFTSNDNRFTELSHFFGDYITAWIQ